MAAAIVTGLIPILRTAVNTSTTYKARTLWFGFLAVRLVVLFLSELPWFKLDTDFSCNGTARDSVCSRACFNKHFDRPAVAAWNFLFVLLLLSVMLMELFSAHLRASARKRSPKQEEKTEELMMLDLHASKTTLLFYLMSVALRIMVEVAFVYILLQWNLPKMESGPYECEPEGNVCPGPQVCIVRAATEKRMSIFALASISCLVIVASCLFFLYAVMHYLCNLGGGSVRDANSHL
ncbi:uncharacterized protein LOC105888748 [Clupea harengus]|uniref:Uncharacterized protein LOC105888748 n=1 Tax=Clupea harengus TaxID=7950 RepID=A0A6P3VF28_CLUHA|nr:uncharacterized protein LOC105888748 [Clupea harengus]